MRSKTRPKPLPCLWACCSAALLWGAACSSQPEQARSLQLRCAHLEDYAWQDRDDDGQPNDFKPDVEVEALIRGLLAEPADLYILRGIGSEASLQHLQQHLKNGLHAHYLPGKDAFCGLGFLCASDQATLLPLERGSYSHLGREQVPMFGSLQLPLSEARKLLVVNAELPDADAPYERRRNEARLLRQALRPLLEDENNLLLLSIHAPEDPDSPMLRELRELGLRALRAIDVQGDAWTHHDKQRDLYRRDQWLFASPALVEWIVDHPRITDSPDLRLAGNTRHQFVELRPPAPAN